MKNIHSVFARFRLLSSVMALAVLLSALAVTPVRAEECDNICSGWNVKDGCVTCSRCCVYPDGHYTCNPIIDNNCGTGGPGLPQ
jgi:hypothetical protein